MTNVTLNSRHLLVQVEIPDVGGDESVSPRGVCVDLLAGRLLHELLSSELFHADLLIEREPGSAAALTRGAYLFEVRDLRQASATVAGVLRRTQLFAFAKISFLDAAEGIWRSIYPERGADFKFDGLLEELQAQEKRASLITDWIVSAVRPHPPTPRDENRGG